MNVGVVSLMVPLGPVPIVGAAGGVSTREGASGGCARSSTVGGGDGEGVGALGEGGRREGAAVTGRRPDRGGAGDRARVAGRAGGGERERRGGVGDGAARHGTDRRRGGRGVDGEGAGGGAARSSAVGGGDGERVGALGEGGEVKEPLLQAVAPTVVGRRWSTCSRSRRRRRSVNVGVVSVIGAARPGADRRRGRGGRCRVDGEGCGWRRRSCPFRPWR